MNAIAGLASLCMLAISACLPLHAKADGADSPLPLGQEWVPVDPARLAEMRGGLMMPSGMVLSFGIERLVYVNGQLVASATLQIPDLGRMTADQASALAAINEGRVVQIGEGNRIDPGASGNALVIQNTLDGQAISALTTLNVGVGTLGMLQEINTYDALHNALIASPGSP
ncbi:MAG TPA: hypothetical protein VFH12_00935 [Pseudoxanthomonas sp.]|nr:hypothetical protein [Pseudoxanthomonas sp.]